MPDFVYTARTLDGKNVTGRLTAANKREALSVLSRQSLFPLTAEEASGKQRSLRISGRISQQLIATNLTQLADLLQNGVPLPMVSRRLGHSTPAVTARVYSHALTGDEQAAEALARALGG